MSVTRGDGRGYLEISVTRGGGRGLRGLGFRIV